MAGQWWAIIAMVEHEIEALRPKRQRTAKTIKTGRKRGARPKKRESYQELEMGDYALTVVKEENGDYLETNDYQNVSEYQCDFVE